MDHVRASKLHTIILLEPSTYSERLFRSPTTVLAQSIGAATTDSCRTSFYSRSVHNQRLHYHSLLEKSTTRPQSTAWQPEPAFAARQQRNKATSCEPCARLHWHIPTELPSASSPQPPPQTSYSTSTDHDSRQYQYTGAGEAGHSKAVWRSIGICQSSLELLGHPDTPCLAMGACMSSDVQDGDQKKRSQMIDRTLEEDSKKLRRECKILLLGMAMVREK